MMRVGPSKHGAEGSARRLEVDNAVSEALHEVELLVELDDGASLPMPRGPKTARAVGVTMASEPLLALHIFEDYPASGDEILLSLLIFRQGQTMTVVRPTRPTRQHVPSGGRVE